MWPEWMTVLNFIFLELRQFVARLMQYIYLQIEPKFVKFAQLFVLCW